MKIGIGFLLGALLFFKGQGELDAYKKRPQKALRRDERKEGTKARLGPAMGRPWLIMIIFL